MSKIKNIKPDFTGVLDKMPQYHIVIHDDDVYTTNYLAKMLKEVLYINIEKAEVFANTIKSEGKEIVYTTHKELAELKVEQLVNYCADDDKPAKISIEKAIC